jgi:thiamine biosynthesis lipoprotein
VQHRFPFRAMASPCELHLHGADRRAVRAAADAAIAEVARIEAKYSRYREDSVASRINASAGEATGLGIDAETAALLDYAATAFEQSDGLFDITSGVLREVWDFRSGRLPSQGAVLRVLERVGWERVRWEGRERITMPAGMQIDFGGYGKEYAADRAAEICHHHGVHAGLVNLGGDVRVIGPHPRPERPSDEDWIVGIRDPRAAAEGAGALGSIRLREGGLATSGDYQRFMLVDGRRYAHILDPHTGWPVVDSLASVSVVAGRCLIAGTATTIAMLKGEAGASWLDQLGLPNLRVDAAGQVSGTLVQAPRYGASSASELASGFPLPSAPGSSGG